MMRYVELFAGAGGMSLGLHRAGLQCVAHAEIEPHARAVLRQHWPDVPLHGDVTAVDWTPYRGQVDLVAGGSPCQDLSVAGKRAGLAGARSGLFYEQVRAWNETGAPALLWENVDGARSSNRGEDFAAVLSTLVGATIPVPADGWRTSGVAAGRTGVAAWRVLDLQYFGPPQRRRRIFVVAVRDTGTGAPDPADVLALAESLCRHPAPQRSTRKNAPAGAGSGAESGGVVGSLEARTHGGEFPGTDGAAAGHVTVQPVAPPAIAFNWQNGGGYGNANEGLGITTEGVGPLQRSQVPAVVPPSGVTPTVTAKWAKGSGGPAGDETQNLVAQTYSAPAIGDVRADDVAGTITRHTGSGAGETQNPAFVVAPTLAMGAQTAAPGSNGRDAVQWAEITTAHGSRPRRLTPLECERLMGWPDEWTAFGVREDGTPYTLSNTARYRLCGNGVGTPVAEWIGRRLVAAFAGDDLSRVAA